MKDCTENLEQFIDTQRKYPWWYGYTSSNAAQKIFYKIWQ